MRQDWLFRIAGGHLIPVSGTQLAVVIDSGKKLLDANKSAAGVRQRFQTT